MAEQVVVEQARSINWEKLFASPIESIISHANGFSVSDGKRQRDFGWKLPGNFASQAVQHGFSVGPHQSDKTAIVATRIAQAQPAKEVQVEQKQTVKITMEELRHKNKPELVQIARDAGVPYSKLTKVQLLTRLANHFRLVQQPVAQATAEATREIRHCVSHIPANNIGSVLLYQEDGVPGPAIRQCKTFTGQKGGLERLDYNVDSHAAWLMKRGFQLVQKGLAKGKNDKIIKFAVLAIPTKS